MIEKRKYHASVSMGNKLFVIGGRYTTNCKVFDSYSRNLTKIKSGIEVPDVEIWNFDSVCIGNYVVIFDNFMAIGYT